MSVKYKKFITNRIMMSSLCGKIVPDLFSLLLMPLHKFPGQMLCSWWKNLYTSRWNVTTVVSFRVFREFEATKIIFLTFLIILFMYLNSLDYFFEIIKKFLQNTPFTITPFIYIKIVYFNHLRLIYSKQKAWL